MELSLFQAIELTRVTIAKNKKFPEMHLLHLNLNIGSA